MLTITFILAAAIVPLSLYTKQYALTAAGVASMMLAFIAMIMEAQA